jgi:dTDP-4-dehydrorhamnose 3,5-epimerase
MGARPAIVANCATMPHDPGEIKRMDPFSKKIPYNWELKNE